MKGFSPSFLDKLMVVDSAGQPSATLARLSLEQLKDSVAKDLEALLNTRAVVPEELLKQFPELNNSIVSYGLKDFAGLSLASADDRADICRSLERAIARHEPRLRNVRASLERDMGNVNRLNFGITALLVVNTCNEPVNFDAVLQPSTLQYTINKSRPTARMGL